MSPPGGHSGGATTPELTVVISTLGNHAGLARVLEGYEEQDVSPSSFEVLVVVDLADPDPDQVRRLVAGRSYPVRLLTGRRRGLSANRNAGWRAAAAPLVLFTDNDTIPRPGLVGQHLDWHARWPAAEVAVVGHVRWARTIRVTPFMHWLDHGIQFDFPHIDGIEAGWGRFYGANVSVKRNLLDRVGDFDEERLPYGYEDLDWSYRASKLGLRVLYNRQAVVEHLREMDLDFWRRRAERLASVERTFIEMYPEIPPYFHRMFSEAAAAPPASGRGRHLIKWVPERVPWLGPKAWKSASLYYRQRLAPHFLEAWTETADRETRPKPYLVEPSTDSPGSD